MNQKINLDEVYPMPEFPELHSNGPGIYNRTEKDLLTYGKKIRKEAFDLGMKIATTNVNNTKK